MSEGKDVKDRHGHRLRSMRPPGDEKDDIAGWGFTQNAGRR